MEVKLEAKVTQTRNGWNEITAATWRYVVTGVPDSTDATDQVMDEVYAESPAQVGNAFRESLDIDENRGGGVWSVEVSYSEDAQDTEGSTGAGPGISGNRAVVSFDTSGGTEHVTSSLKAPKKFGKAGAKIPDPGLLIGWKDKTKAECDGVDKVAPSMRKTVVQRMSALSTRYENLLIDLTGTVNSNKFMGREPGEVLFLGASGSDPGRGKFDVTFNFAIQRNETVEIEGIKVEKKGWEYVWSITKPTIPGDGQPPKILIEGIYVSPIYKETDFRQLGLHV